MPPQSTELFSTLSALDSEGSLQSDSERILGFHRTLRAIEAKSTSALPNALLIECQFGLMGTTSLQSQFFVNIFPAGHPVANPFWY
jgi:hypothetical protein